MSKKKMSNKNKMPFIDLSVQCLNGEGCRLKLSGSYTGLDVYRMVSTQLPPKKMFTVKDHEYLDSVKHLFEKFLKVCNQKDDHWDRDSNVLAYCTQYVKFACCSYTFNSVIL